MRRIALYNDFHNTKVDLELPDSGVLSASQVARARRQLCGMKDCVCGGYLGERGPQRLGGRYEIIPLKDGRAKIIIDSP